jgi:hypothetical protein
MGKFPFIVEHNVFDIRASFLQFPIKMGNFHKNVKSPKNMGKFPFNVEHKVFVKKSSFLQIPIKMGKFP